MKTMKTKLTELGWTTADLDLFPEPLDDTRYEIIEGELFVSKQPSAEHQYVCGRLNTELQLWSQQTGAGITLPAPGIIFADDDNVAPDVIWASTERLQQILGSDGKLHAAPELVVEVLSPGERNERRDLEAKVRLYSRQRVDEYWIADWDARTVAVYRRAPDATLLQLVTTLGADGRLESPLLPGFGVQVSTLFFPLRRPAPQS